MLRKAAMLGKAAALLRIGRSTASLPPLDEQMMGSRFRQGISTPYSSVTQNLPALEMERPQYSPKTDCRDVFRALSKKTNSAMSRRRSRKPLPSWPIADARKLGLDDRAIGGLYGRPEVPAVAPRHGRCLRTSLEAPKMILEAGKSLTVLLNPRGQIFEVVAHPLPEPAAVGPREVQACVGDGGLAKSS